MTADPTSSEVFRFTTPAEALRRVTDDYLRWEYDPEQPCTGWGSDRALIVLSTERSAAGWLVGLGDPDAVLRLLDAARGDLPAGLRGISLPQMLAARLPEWLAVDPSRVGEWEWMRTYAPPPVQPLEDRVEWMTGADAEIAQLLAHASPRHSAAPGDADIRRWCGIRDWTGPGRERLLACGAHTEHVAGVPHLASIATLPEARGRGLGAAVTAWLTRAAFSAGAPTVTLGMYADNDAARRVYRRLGFTTTHEFFSVTLRRV